MREKIRITQGDFEKETAELPTDIVFYLIFSGLLTVVSFFEIFYFLLTIEKIPHQIYNFAVAELIFAFPSFIFFAAGLFGCLTKKFWTITLNIIFLPIYSIWRLIMIILMIPDQNVLEILSDTQIRTFILVSIVVILVCEYFTIYFLSEKSKIHFGS